MDAAEITVALLVFAVSTAAAVKLARVVAARAAARTWTRRIEDADAAAVVAASRATYPQAWARADATGPGRHRSRPGRRRRLRHTAPAAIDAEYYEAVDA